MSSKYNRKLSIEQVSQIQLLRTYGVPLNDIAEHFGCSVPAINYHTRYIPKDGRKMLEFILKYAQELARAA